MTSTASAQVWSQQQSRSAGRRGAIAPVGEGRVNTGPPATQGRGQAERGQKAAEAGTNADQPGAEQHLRMLSTEPKRATSGASE